MPGMPSQPAIFFLTRVGSAWTSFTDLGPNRIVWVWRNARSICRRRHNVTVLYLTRGEAGLKNGDQVTAEGCAAEALRACELLGANAMFAD